MQVSSHIYGTVPGNSSITIATLAFRKILSVKREGIGYNIITDGTPGNREVLYNSSDGSFTFETPFNGQLSGGNGINGMGGFIFLTIVNQEKIFIMWDENN